MIMAVYLRTWSGDSEVFEASESHRLWVYSLVLAMETLVHNFNPVPPNSLFFGKTSSPRFSSNQVRIISSGSHWRGGNLKMALAAQDSCNKIHYLVREYRYVNLFVNVSVNVFPSMRMRFFSWLFSIDTTVCKTNL